MDFSQLKQKVYLQFIFKIIIYKELFEKSVIIIICNKTILTFYNKLEESVVGDDQYQIVLNLCNKPNTFKTRHTTEKKNTCKKLLRNLFLCSRLDRDEVMNCCGNLYVWLYFEIEKSSISNEIIKKIFELPTSDENEGLRYYACPYATFNDEIDNPENLMKLSIFNDNVATFHSILKESKESKDCDLKRYVYECVDIYNKINKAYDFPPVCNNIPQENTCGIINDFRGYYMSHIFNKPEITLNFPELSSDTNLNDIKGCPSEERKSDAPPEEKLQVTPTTGGASTALSAMVGIPPFLILMYKVNIIRT
ncbi:hypothetical protein PVIIG_05444 [Plasmodium vivax India VII]|uniref:Uncharacterized protein n=1 Tax=Plasmodium vivax India VII TaxID=1077284 RepID=A0A0J9S2U5_PLAVI|nr:hypothetical protein PVIIG_05444 [Plasmodium vivax India VII]